VRIDKRKLELAMARKQMSYKQLTVESGLSRETVCCNAGKRNLYPSTIGRIAAVLGVDVTEIIAEEEES
jgi:lambda repressor-like predicted transcriptional regulator